MEPETGVRTSYLAPKIGCMTQSGAKIKFDGYEILWMLALCAMAERGEFPQITLPYKSRGALVLSDGKWGVTPIKLREMLDEQHRARKLLKGSGADG